MAKLTVIVPRTGFESKLAGHLASNVVLPALRVEDEDQAPEAGAALINKEIVENGLGLGKVSADEVMAYEIVDYSDEGNVVVGWEVEGWSHSLTNDPWG